MPVFGVDTFLEIAKGIKMSLKMEAGLTRGEVPNPEQSLKQAPSRTKDKKKGEKKKGENRQPKRKPKQERLEGRPRGRSGTPDWKLSQRQRDSLSKLSTEEIRTAIAGVDHWFHRIEFTPEVVAPGIHNSGEVLEAMELPDRLDGKRVLDIGARDGYYSFAAEARGAEVVAIDTVPPEFTGFEVAASLLGSSVEFRTANVYDLSLEEFGTFDVIFFLGVLYHLRDPMLALDRLWSVARPGAEIWIESHVMDNVLVDPATGRYRKLVSVAPEMVDIPIAQFYPRGDLDKNPSNWWGPNLSGLRAMVESAGFAVSRAQLFAGSRGLIVGHKVEDAETNFWRDFDRGAGVRDRGMAWEHYEGHQ